MDVLLEHRQIQLKKKKNTITFNKAILIGDNHFISLGNNF